MANFLTALRLLISIPAALSIALVLMFSPEVTVLLIVIAIVTDFFDGKIARRFGTASSRGQLFDHSTDFFFVTSCLFGAAYAGLVTPILPILIVIAFSQYVLDSHFFYHEKQLHMSRLGRWNGILYFAPILAIACSRTPVLSEVSGYISGGVFVFGWILVLSTVLSILDRAMAPLHSHPPHNGPAHNHANQSHPHQKG
ncbi:MAG: CDP-alcohol phosphatidyltransferase family protein [Pseudomonadales bacterium]|nr:CDP-alcohol phosphatidyltransferase family protein [Planctomycetaceae bacterium]MCB1670598.1 CDP-alcohol phosphatidyltransferase family protein [Pseudomonadales bacterium]MCP5348317.1 CDP-alcohol phosphatidyltransferase family protein [Pseudomonadales bacterium]